MQSLRDASLKKVLEKNSLSKIIKDMQSGKINPNKLGFDGISGFLIYILEQNLPYVPMQREDLTDENDWIGLVENWINGKKHNLVIIPNVDNYYDDFIENIEEDIKTIAISGKDAFNLRNRIFRDKNNGRDTLFEFIIDWLRITNYYPIQTREDNFRKIFVANVTDLENRVRKNTELYTTFFFTYEDCVIWIRDQINILKEKNGYYPKIPVGNGLRILDMEYLEKELSDFNNVLVLRISTDYKFSILKTLYIKNFHLD